MTATPLRTAACAALLALLAACSGTGDRADAASDARPAADARPDVRPPQPDAAVDVPRDDDVASRADGDAGGDVGVDAPPVDVLSATGLDTRPANPTCRAFARPTLSGGVAVTHVFTSLPRFANPVYVTQAPGDRTRFFVVEQTGQIRAFANSPTVSTSSVFLDIATRVVFTGEAGLLGLAFHPGWATNRTAFVSYTGRPCPTGGGVICSRISRFRSNDGGATLDPATEQVVLELPQPAFNHNGGGIQFGPDGYLYIGFGDGGGGGDPLRAGQDPMTLLGKFVRIDVNATGMPYAIPPDNPFARGGGRPEIYALGFRNPWRWSFDRATGELWAGDVGQGINEEVDRVQRGGNYGWNQWEGTYCYSPPCTRAGFTFPVVEYGRTEGVSITGGYVYRGTRIPSLVGQFVYGDFGSTRLWSVAYDAMGRPTARPLGMTGFAIASFGEDLDGEVYVVDYGGRIFQLQPGPTTGMDTVPATLSATGCFDAGGRVAPGAIPYDVNAELWSDGATKERFLALPDGARIRVGADGDWELPVGAVLIKTFSVAGRRVETRLLVRHSDGDWAGYTYAWNAAGTDATLLAANQTVDLGGGRSWYFPSRAECMQCHTTAAGRSLGLETAQLNRTLFYPSTGRTANELATLEAIGLFESPLGMPPAMLPALPPPGGTTGTLPDRARAYLHANCANCHRPSGTGGGMADMRFATPFAMQNLCNATPGSGTLGIAGARLIQQGDPARSIVSRRMHALDATRMPPLASRVVDTAGVDVIDRWITSLTSCP